MTDSTAFAMPEGRGRLGNCPHIFEKRSEHSQTTNLILMEWSGRVDLNHRPPGPEPGALARLRYAPNLNDDAQQFTWDDGERQLAINRTIVARFISPRDCAYESNGGCTQKGGLPWDRFDSAEACFPLPIGMR
jgi:hypothetical protein